MSATKSTLKNCLTYLPTYLILCFMLIPFTSLAEEEFTNDPELGYVRGQLLIQLEGEIDLGLFLDDYVHTGFPEVDELNQKYGVYLAVLAWGGENTGPAPPDLANCYVFYFPDLNLDMEEVAEEYKGANGVLEAEPDYLRWGMGYRDPGDPIGPEPPPKETSSSEISEISSLAKGVLFPDDDYFYYQWYLYSLINIIYGDVDIDAPEAWYELSLNSSERKVYLAVLDTARNPHHDCHGDLIDEDRSYNFVLDDIQYYYGLGEHYRSNVAMFNAVTNNEETDYYGHSLIASTNWDGNLNYLPIGIVVYVVLEEFRDGNWWDPGGYEYLYAAGTIRNCVSAMLRAYNNVIHIIYISYGGCNYSAFEEKMAEYLVWDKDVLIVAPAGYPTSGKSDGGMKIHEVYPAALEETLSIGVSDRFNQKSDLSNEYSNIELYAPGVDCLTLYEEFTAYFYCHYVSGASISAALVSGVAGAFMHLHGHSGTFARNALINYSDQLSSGEPKLNYYKAIMMTKSESPTLGDFNEKHELAESLSENTPKVSIYPNPVIDEANISISLPTMENQRVTITIYDLSGRAVHQWEECIEGGYATIYWNCCASNGDLAPQGVYILSVSCENETIRENFVVLR